MGTGMNFRFITAFSLFVWLPRPRLPTAIETFSLEHTSVSLTEMTSTDLEITLLQADKACTYQGRDSFSQHLLAVGRNSGMQVWHYPDRLARMYWCLASTLTVVRDLGATNYSCNRTLGDVDTHNASCDTGIIAFYARCTRRLHVHVVKRAGSCRNSIALFAGFGQLA